MLSGVEAQIMYFNSIGIPDQLSEREHILVAGSILLWSIPSYVYFIMGTVCFVVGYEGPL